MQKYLIGLLFVAGLNWGRVRYDPCDHSVPTDPNVWVKTAGITLGLILWPGTLGIHLGDFMARMTEHCQVPTPPYRAAPERGHHQP